MADKYVRLRKIGSGGMATVYLARRLESNDLVALKVLNKEVTSDEEYVRRFFREARIISQLNHPNIIKIFESNFGDGEFFMVTEYLDGGNLNTILRNTVIKLTQKIGILNKIISALDYTHQQGIIHRDIKPSNILLSQDLKPKLCDFGIATALWGQESRLTRTNEIMGTMDYISPEQKENAKTVDFRADIFSIGVILYRIITGRKPTGAFLPPKDVISSIPNELNDLVMKCLQPRPLDRYKSTYNLYKELSSIIEIMERPSKSKSIYSEEISGEERDERTKIGSFTYKKILERMKKGSMTEKMSLKEQLIESVDGINPNDLIKLFESEEGFIKKTIIEALGRLKMKAACQGLIKLLPDPQYSKEVALALGDIPCPQAENSLMDILSSGREDSYIAIEPLGKLNSGKAIKPLAKFLKNEHKWIRELTLDSLALIKDKRIYKYVENTSTEDESAEIRAKAKNILWRLKK